MLIQFRSLSQLPIASVRSGGRIGRINGVILNPDTLQVAAYHCSITGVGRRLMLPQDIFETTRLGIIIRDHDSLISEEDAIRLKPLLNLKYPLIGLRAFVGKRRVGVVEDYAVETTTHDIMKIYVKPGVLMKLKSSQLIFERQSVRETTRAAIYFYDSSVVPVGGLAQPVF